MSRSSRRVITPETMVALYPVASCRMRRPPAGKLAIADPKLAPYGAAAMEALKNLGVLQVWQPHLVQGENIVAIPGTKRVQRLNENAAAASLNLDPNELAQLSEAIPAGAAAGGRYSEGAMKRVNL